MIFCTNKTFSKKNKVQVNLPDTEEKSPSSKRVKNNSVFKLIRKVLNENLFLSSDDMITEINKLDDVLSNHHKTYIFRYLNNLLSRNVILRFGPRGNSVYALRENKEKVFKKLGLVPFRDKTKVAKARFARFERESILRKQKIEQGLCSRPECENKLMSGKKICAEHNRQLAEARNSKVVSV